MSVHVYSGNGTHIQWSMVNPDLLSNSCFKTFILSVDMGFALFFTKPFVTSGQGQQIKISLLAKSGIFTEFFINVHSPCQIHK